MSAFHADGNQRLALVRGCPRLRQCTPFAGAAAHRRSTQATTAGQGWPRVPALAHGAADHTGWIFQTRRHGKLRRCAEDPTSVRPAARRSSGSNFSLPCSMACERQRGVDGRSQARVRLVSGQQRPPDIAWSTLIPEVAWTGCIPTDQMKIEAQSSVVSYLLGLAEMRQFARAGMATSPAELAHKLALSA